MIEQLEILEVGPFARAEVEFAPRLNLFFGDNFADKSALLDAAWFAMTRTFATYALLPRAAKTGEPSVGASTVEADGQCQVEQLPYSVADLEWQVPAQSPFHSQLVFYSRGDMGFSLWDPARNLWVGPGSGCAVRAGGAEAFHFRDAEVLHGHQAVERDGQNRFECAGLLADWPTWRQDSTGGRAEPFAAFVRLLELLSPACDGMRPNPGASGAVCPALLTPLGAVPFTHASRALQRWLASAYLLSWMQFHHRAACRQAAREPAGGLVLLCDEVEAHLPTAGQERVLAGLLQTGAFLSPLFQIVATTQSPVVLASFKAVADPEKDRLFNVSMSGANQEVEQAAWP